MSLTFLTFSCTGDDEVDREVWDTVEDICEISGCEMEFDCPNFEQVVWSFSFKNENQEECTRSMLLDLVRDFPYNLSLK